MSKQFQLRLGPVPRRRKTFRQRPETPSWRAPVIRDVPQAAFQFPSGHPVREYELKPHVSNKS